MSAGSWLMLAVGDDRQHGGNDGYDDSPSTHYSWDETAPNHGAIRRGDRIATWDKHTLLGISSIESIEKGRLLKQFHSCPDCEKDTGPPRLASGWGRLRSGTGSYSSSAPAVPSPARHPSRYSRRLTSTATLIAADITTTVVSC